MQIKQGHTSVNIDSQHHDVLYKKTIETIFNNGLPIQRLDLNYQSEVIPDQIMTELTLTLKKWFIDCVCVYKTSVCVSIPL